MNHMPIPRDIPLPLPAGEYFLQGLLVLAFIAHIVFVNLMVGGSILVFAFELRGRRQPDYDKLARALAETLTVNKSLAVVLGVAPLLLINVLYTIHFYTANALTGSAWILLIPTIATTFLLLYLHKYTWDRLAQLKGIHLAIQGFAVALLLFIPLVFLSNINLMLFPERWTSIHGFWSAVALDNVIPRYFHFLSASLILTSLFGVGYFGRAKFPIESTFETFDRPRLRREFYSIAFATSLAQYVIGPLVLFTLPTKGLHVSVVLAIATGALVSLPAVWGIWKELAEPQPRGKRLPFIAAYLGIAVFCMATGRHMYRSVALSEHRSLMAKATAKWADESAQAAYDLAQGYERPNAVADGRSLFEATCSGCHGIDHRIVGPPLTEIAKIYGSNPSGIVVWARAPGKKREGFPQMPPFASLGDTKLGAIAKYMVEAGSGAGSAH